MTASESPKGNQDIVSSAAEEDSPCDASALSASESYHDARSTSTDERPIEAWSEEDVPRRGFFKTFFASSGAPQILVLAMLLSLGIGSLVSVVPGVVADRFARVNHHYTGQSCADFGRTDKPDECQSGGDDAQNAAAMAAFGKNLLILTFSSVVGSISDCRGRKGFLAFSFFLSSLAPLALLLLQLDDSMHPLWYYVADCSQGLVSASAISFATLSDILPPSLRAPGFGLFFAAFMSGFALSQLLAISLSHIVVSVVACAMTMSACIFTLIAVPETLSEETSRKALAKKLAEGNTWGAAMLRPIKELSILNRNSFFRLLAVVSFCQAMIYSSDKTLVIYYMDSQLDIGYQFIASMLFFMAILGVLVQVFVLKAVIGWFGEKNVLIMGCLFGASHNFLYGIADSKLSVFVALCVSELTSITFPVITAMRSFNVGEDEQGHIQGAFFALAAVADAIGPVSLQAIFRRTKDGAFFGPGTMFMFAAAVYIVGASVACILPSERANSQRTERETLREDESIELDSLQEPLLDKSGSDAVPPDGHVGIP